MTQRLSVVVDCLVCTVAKSDLTIALFVLSKQHTFEQDGFPLSVSKTPFSRQGAAQTSWRTLPGLMTSGHVEYIRPTQAHDIFSFRVHLLSYKCSDLLSRKHYEQFRYFSRLCVFVDCRILEQTTLKQLESLDTRSAVPKDFAENEVTRSVEESNSFNPIQLSFGPLAQSLM